MSTPQARNPAIEVIIAALAVTLVACQHREMAVFVLTATYCYLRPGEARKLMNRSVVEPAASSRCESHLRKVSIIVAPAQDRDPSKTGTFDDTIIVDHPPFLSDLL